ncbi:MAG: hypothetical protein AAB363_05685 [Planctomycetota bacterium]
MPEFVDRLDGPDKVLITPICPQQSKMSDSDRQPAQIVSLIEGSVPHANQGSEHPLNRDAGKVDGSDPASDGQQGPSFPESLQSARPVCVSPKLHLET